MICKHYVPQVSTRDCSHSEWSDEDDNEDGQTNNDQEECPDRESNGYTTDEQGLENVSLLNEAGLTDAEGTYCYDLSNYN